MSLEAHVALSLGTLDLDVTIAIGAGETVALLGPNGAGKTTLLRALAGLLPLAAGTVVVDGVTLDDVAGRRHVPAERRPVGIVFQDYRLFPHLSALDNVAYGLRAQGIRPREARRRAAGQLERMGLADHAGARPAALSGGQQQRVALARALVCEPRLLLLDEPLAALDVGTRRAVRRSLRDDLAGYSGTRILVTHDPVDAMAIADRLMVLERGRIVQAGTAAEITGRPRSDYVADLVGVNLFRGRVDAGTIALEGGGSLVAPTGDMAGDVLAVVHPRAVALHREPPGGTPRNTWTGRAVSVDAEGERARVQVDGRPSIVAEVTAEAVAALDLIGGGDVWVSVKATEISVYPA
jgi:molybdate transport system ATP-binding protein